MKLKLMMLVSLFAFGFAMNANAGAVVDGDSDLVPDAFDNCTTLANGPAGPSNQVDSDTDGYGNACDSDYNNDGATTTLDFPTFLDAFTGATGTTVTDHNGDGATSTLDFSRFLSDFQGVTALGPGLPCANIVATVCVP